jgi:two-component system OmpR family sensor kinase
LEALQASVARKKIGVFTDLRSRLMLSFSALLLVCLCIVTVTFTLLFFVRISLPELAYAHLMDAAVPALTQIRTEREPGQRLAESFGRLGALAAERGVRILLVSLPDGTILADTNQLWVGKQVQVSAPPKDNAPRATLRGRLRGPDRKWLFYVAIPLQEVSGEEPRRVHLALVMTLWETARPFIGSLGTSVLLSGAVAFALSILFALWLTRTLSRPLRRAAVAAERVAAGDYSASLDITIPDEGRRLAESFNAMIGAVEASQRSQRDFVANVSHELKTPLTSIQGFAQAIVDGTADDKGSVQRAAAVIHDEANRLSRLVHKLLDLTRLESGEISMSWNCIDLAALLRSCADRFAIMAKEQGVVLSTSLPHELHITGDGDRLMQVFTNLVDNALKYTPNGGKVTLSAKKDGNTASISVADTGVGISETDRPRIFERFYRVDKARSRNASEQSTGAGLGLAIAYEFVRAHGGQIRAESIVDVGTRFTVTLPLKPFSSLGQQDLAGGPA